MTKEILTLRVKSLIYNLIEQPQNVEIAVWALISNTYADCTEEYRDKIYKGTLEALQNYKKTEG